MTHITHFGGKKMYNFGLIYEVEVPEKKNAFAPKEWKSEIYEEMKATAFNEFDMICKEVLARVQNGSESW